MKTYSKILFMLQMVSCIILLSCSQKKEIGFAEVNGTSIYYELKGKGTPMVFMHGFALDMRYWDSQIEKFSSDYTVLRYDYKGFGKSQIPDTLQPYSHHEDLKALLDYLDLEKVVLIAHSMGGIP
ncbi:MAG: alpha/beta hydrolase, partial [Bacteroidales bacterium]|nr:alpha/beta hydrolase [Bacteroidales bacterium]